MSGKAKGVGAKTFDSGLDLDHNVRATWIFGVWLPRNKRKQSLQHLRFKPLQAGLEAALPLGCDHWPGHQARPLTQSSGAS